MISFIIIYNIFSYLFVFGIQYGNIFNKKRPNYWNLLLSPLMFPILIGFFFTDILIEIRNINQNLKN